MTLRTKNTLRVAAGVVAALIVIFLIVLFWPASRPPSVAASPATPELLARGQYLTTAADCIACHTVEGGTPYAGGRAFKLPFGTLYAPNITPDRETGIGAWTDGEFLQAMHDGIGRNGKQLYPAFPYTSYSKLADADVLAIKAYLFSLAPVRQQAPTGELKFPFSERRLMRFWNVLFARGGQYEAEPAQSAEWNRGAYLVEGLGHCGECHTPRNLLYGHSHKKLAGETMQGWTAWNITSDREHGIGAWSVDELTSYLREGHAEGRAVASGPMREAVEYSLSHLEPADLRAMAVYLKTVPPIAEGPVPATSIERVDADNPLGEQIFAGACASCHARTGHGTQTPLAMLSGLRSVSDPQGVNVMQIVLRGGKTSAVNAFMPAFAHAYSDEEIAAVTNFVIAGFGGQLGTITAGDVAEARQ